MNDSEFKKLEDLKRLTSELYDYIKCNHDKEALNKIIVIDNKLWDLIINVKK